MHSQQGGPVCLPQSRSIGKATLAHRHRINFTLKDHPPSVAIDLHSRRWRGLWLEPSKTSQPSGFPRLILKEWVAALHSASCGGVPEKPRQFSTPEYSHRHALHEQQSYPRHKHHPQRRTQVRGDRHRHARTRPQSQIRRNAQRTLRQQHQQRARSYTPVAPRQPLRRAFCPVFSSRRCVWQFIARS